METMATTEEIEIVKDFILLPMLLTIVDNEIAKLEQSSYALKKLYIGNNRIVQDNITKDLTRVRSNMTQRAIKAWPVDKGDCAFRFQYQIRGYRGEFEMLKFVAKAELGKRLAVYVDGVFK